MNQKQHNTDTTKVIPTKEEQEETIKDLEETQALVEARDAQKRKDRSKDDVIEELQELVAKLMAEKAEVKAEEPKVIKIDTPPQHGPYVWMRGLEPCGARSGIELGEGAYATPKLVVEMKETWFDLPKGQDGEYRYKQSPEIVSFKAKDLRRHILVIEALEGKVMEKARAKVLRMQQLSAKAKQERSK